MCKLVDVCQCALPCHNATNDIEQREPVHYHPAKVHLQFVDVVFRVFELLRWRLGTLLLCGFQALVPYFPFVGTFAELPRQQREVVLQTWATSSIAQFRKVTHANAAQGSLLKAALQDYLMATLI